MDRQKDYSCFERNEKIFSKNIEIEEDFSETLPAYCDDIYRVVKCVSHSYVSSVNISPPEVIIMGKCEVMLTYYNENSCLCYADFEEDFIRNISVDNLSDYSFALADICDKYTNFRVINQRRIDVHSSALISLAVYDRQQCPCLNSCDGAKLKSDSINSANIIASNISKIEFDEEFTLPADSKPIKRIISSSCIAAITETKIIKDKVLVKASVEAKLLYTSDEDNEEIFAVNNSFNLSKIIDQSAIDENDIMISEIKVGSLFHKAKASGGDKLCVAEIFGDVVINSVFIREQQCELVTDGYMTRNKSSCSYSDIKTAAHTKHISDLATVNMSLEVPNEIKEIKEISISFSPHNIRNSKLIFKADTTVLYQNESGALASAGISDEISFDAGDRENAYASLNLKSVDYSISSSKRVDLRLNTQLNAFLYDVVPVKVLSDIEEGEENGDAASITVYFAKENESIWNIAKSFSSDTDLIMGENELKSDIVDKDRIILIPRV